MENSSPVFLQMLAVGIFCVVCVCYPMVDTITVIDRRERESHLSHSFALDSCLWISVSLLGIKRQIKIETTHVWILKYCHLLMCFEISSGFPARKARLIFALLLSIGHRHRPVKTVWVAADHRSMISAECKHFTGSERTLDMRFVKGIYEKCVALCFCTLFLFTVSRPAPVLDRNMRNISPLSCSSGWTTNMPQ